MGDALDYAELRKRRLLQNAAMLEELGLKDGIGARLPKPKPAHRKRPVRAAALPYTHPLSLISPVL